MAIAYSTSSHFLNQSWLSQLSPSKYQLFFSVARRVSTTMMLWITNASLQWRHNGRDGVSSHQPRDCLHNRLFRRTSKKTSKLRVTGLCVVNSPRDGEFHAHMASNAENVFIWWRHHVLRAFVEFRLYHVHVFKLLFRLVDISIWYAIWHAFHYWMESKSP